MSDADAALHGRACSPMRARSPISSRPISTPTSASWPAPSRRPRRSGASTTAPPASACAARTARRCAIECRVGGADLNPYLAFAALIAAGLDGIEKKLSSSRPSSAMPITARSSAKSRRPCARRPTLLDKSKLLREALGDDVIDHYVHTARVGAVRIRPPDHRLGVEAGLRAILRLSRWQLAARAHAQVSAASSWMEQHDRDRSRCVSPRRRPRLCRAAGRERRRDRGGAVDAAPRPRQGEWARGCRSPSARARAAARLVDALLAMNDEIVPELAWQMGRPVRYGGEKRGVEERVAHMIAIAEEALAPLEPTGQGRLPPLRSRASRSASCWSSRRGTIPT